MPQGWLVALLASLTAWAAVFELGIARPGSAVFLGCQRYINAMTCRT